MEWDKSKVGQEMDDKARPERRCLARSGPGLSMMPQSPLPWRWPCLWPHCKSLSLSPSPFCGTKLGVSHFSHGQVLALQSAVAQSVLYEEECRCPLPCRALSVCEASFLPLLLSPVWGLHPPAQGCSQEAQQQLNRRPCTSVPITGPLSCS